MNNPAIKIKMQGLAIGDGLCDPENVSGSHYCIILCVHFFISTRTNKC